MFPIAIGLGALWGWGMDKLFHTWPWLTIIFTFFGVVAAFVNLFRIGLRD
jgi:F0F1-type ATP synthase assembly protein I